MFFETLYRMVAGNAVDTRLLLQVVYFNTYLADPRRPQLPEHPTTRIILASLQAKEGQLAVPSGFHGPPPAVMGYRPPPMVYPG